MGDNRGTPVERFWARVTGAGDDGCWLWTGHMNPNGYCQFKVDRRLVYVHRWAYEALRGPIPDGLQLDHLCRVRHCVNPAHLEPVSCRVNLQRGERAGDEFVCRNGHDRASNTYVKPSGHWVCRQCRRDAKRRRQAARREALSAASR